MRPEGSQKEVRRQAKGMRAEVLVELARMSNSTERRIWHSRGSRRHIKRPTEFSTCREEGMKSVGRQVKEGLEEEPVQADEDLFLFCM